MEEMMILEMLLCVGLAGLGLKMKMWPVTFISSICWIVIGCQLFKDTEEWLALALIIMIAVAQIIMVRDSE